MSVRAMLGTSRVLYTCLCRPVQESGKILKVRQNPLYVPVSHVSKTPSSSETKEMIEEEIKEEARLNSMETNTREFPTFETHKLLVKGVPFSELPIISIKAGKNNTIANISKADGKSVGHSSSGCVGFRNKRKGTTIAAQAVALDIAKQAKKQEIETVRVILKGIGPGRLPFLRQLQLVGMNIVSISDATHTPFNGNRPSNPRVR